MTDTATIRLPDGRYVELVEGRTYRVTTRTGTQKHPRVSVMRFLWPDRFQTSLFFSARPAFGTQELPRGSILDVVEVPSDTPVVMNRVVR